MSTTKSDSRPATHVLLTVNEAAYVASVSPRTVNQAIDRREIRVMSLRHAGETAGRGLAGAEILYLRVNSLLSPKARRAVYGAISGLDLKEVPPFIELEGAVRLDIREPLADVRSRLGEVERIHARIHADPEVRAGEPVFRGTRIPVYMIAKFVLQGVPRAELLEDYPALDDEALDVAVRYAELHPRRGRPKEAPWRNGEVLLRYTSEQLRD
jgi:uncharacterized protein (DUF433 family)